MVSVDVKHHVYLLLMAAAAADLTAGRNKCGASNETSEKVVAVAMVTARSRQQHQPVVLRRC